MKILHIQRSKPDETIRKLIREISKSQNTQVIPLFTEYVDYRLLIDEIFSSDRVICWW